MKIQSRSGAGLAGLALLALGTYSLSSAGPAPASPTPGAGHILQLPWLIYEPGYYYIDENLTGSQGIQVDAPDVVIDFCGYTIKSDGTQAARGVSFLGSATNVTVKNGSVVGWDGGGVQLPPNSKALDLHVRSCGDGLRVGERSVVERCSMDLNAGRSLSVGEDSLVKCCRINSPGTERIAASFDHGSVVHDLHAIGGETTIFGGQDVQLHRCKVEARGLRGIALGSHALLRDCSVQPAAGETQAKGILVGPFSRIDSCTVRDIGGVGIETGAYGAVSASTVTAVGLEGIVVAEGSQVRECVANACISTGGVDGAGIRGGNDVVVRDSNASANGGSGIRLNGRGGRVEGCSAYMNSLHGIHLQSEAMVERNLAARNLRAGIRVSGGEGVLWQNYAHENENGISVGGLLSVVKENHATKNAGQDFIVPWGNTHGPYEQSPALIQQTKAQANFETPFGY